MIEDFFDLKIATVAPGETPPPEAHLVRLTGAPPDPEGWFAAPRQVTYVSKVPGTIGAGHARTVRSMERKVQARYRLVEDPGVKRFDEFHALYRKTVADRPRGIDRISEHERPADKWSGLYLVENDTMVAGVLLQRLGRHISVSYGGFDPGHCRKLDLEHFLIRRALDKSGKLGFKEMSLGVDTNRYGHHLSLGLPAYKWRIGFTAKPYLLGGWDFMKPQRFDVFEQGFFFYAIGKRGLEGHLFARTKPDVRKWRHAAGPPVTMHAI